jgi:hypothetical protein
LTCIDGLEFDHAWQNRQQKTYEDLTFFVLARHDLLTNKLASGRPKDIADAAWLKEQE